MKKRILNRLKKIIKKNYKDYEDDKIDEIMYGLEAIYLTITKMIIIICISLVLGIIKETFLLLIIYNFIRINAFGLHATKSLYCLITSIIMFVGGVYICKYINILPIIKFLLAVISVILIYKYAPADTEKRPLINKKKRQKYKIFSTISSVIITILIVIFNNSIISNYLLLGMIEAVLMILPVVYRIFNLPYDNYRNYNYGLSN